MTFTYALQHLQMHQPAAIDLRPPGGIMACIADPGGIITTRDIECGKRLGDENNGAGLRQLQDTRIDQRVYLELKERNFDVPGWLFSSGTLRMLADPPRGGATDVIRTQWLCENRRAPGRGR